MMRIIRLLILTGLTMLAAARDKAIFEILVDGGAKTRDRSLVGQFSPVGATAEAGGRIIQMHPLGLCNDDDDDLYEQETGWVGVVKLESSDVDMPPCLTLYQKAQKAMSRGASAVVFDVSDSPAALRELLRHKQPALERPVIIVKGKDARKLRSILLRRSHNAKATIRHEKVEHRISTESLTRLAFLITLLHGSHSKTGKKARQGNNKEFFDMGIFLAFFVLFCLICLIVILKWKWKHNKPQLSMSELAKQALNKLEIRKYKSADGYPVRSHSHTSELCSVDSNLETCAVCLEEYRDGQEIRILPCLHEFHKVCIDPWLLANHTCPLCLFNIIAESESEDNQSVCSAPGGTVASRLAHAGANPRIVPSETVASRLAQASRDPWTTTRNQPPPQYRLPQFQLSSRQQSIRSAHAQFVLPVSHHCRPSQSFGQHSQAVNHPTMNFNHLSQVFNHHSQPFNLQSQTFNHQLPRDLLCKQKCAFNHHYQTSYHDNQPHDLFYSMSNNYSEAKPRMSNSQSCYGYMLSATRGQQHQLAYVNRHALEEHYTTHHNKLNRNALDEYLNDHNYEHSLCINRDMYVNHALTTTSPLCNNVYIERDFTNCGRNVCQPESRMRSHSECCSLCCRGRSWTSTLRSPSYQNACQIDRQLQTNSRQRFTWTGTETSGASSDSDMDTRKHRNHSFSDDDRGGHVTNACSGHKMASSSLCQYGSDSSVTDASNHSTFGSSDLPSEVSSYHSNVYCDTVVSSPPLHCDERQETDSPCVFCSQREPPAVHLRPSCLSERCTSRQHKDCIIHHHPTSSLKDSSVRRPSCSEHRCFRSTERVSLTDLEHHTEQDNYTCSLHLSSNSRQEENPVPHSSRLRRTENTIGQYCDSDQGGCTLVGNFNQESVSLQENASSCESVNGLFCNEATCATVKGQLGNVHHISCRGELVKNPSKDDIVAHKRSSSSLGSARNSGISALVSNLESVCGDSQSSCNSSYREDFCYANSNLLKCTCRNRDHTDDGSYQQNNPELTYNIPSCHHRFILNDKNVELIKSNTSSSPMNTLTPAIGVTEHLPVVNRGNEVNQQPFTKIPVKNEVNLHPFSYTPQRADRTDVVNSPPLTDHHDVRTSQTVVTHDASEQTFTCRSCQKTTDKAETCMRSVVIYNEPDGTVTTLPLDDTKVSNAAYTL